MSGWRIYEALETLFELGNRFATTNGLVSLWSGKKPIYFKIRRKGRDEPFETVMDLVEVLRSRSGALFFRDECTDRLYACRDIASSIYYRNECRDLYAFLCIDLGIRPESVGLAPAWKGDITVHLTAEVDALSFQTEKVTLSQVMRHASGGRFLVCRDRRDRVHLVRFKDVRAVHRNGMRYALPVFARKVLGLA